jgi:hypothetical protein
MAVPWEEVYSMAFFLGLFLKTYWKEKKYGTDKSTTARS